MEMNFPFGFMEMNSVLNILFQAYPALILQKKGMYKAPNQALT